MVTVRGCTCLWRYLAVAAVFAFAMLMSAGCGTSGGGIAAERDGPPQPSLPPGVAALVDDAAITEEMLEREIEKSVALIESEGRPVPGEGSDQHRELVRSAMRILVQQRVISTEAHRCGEPCDVSQDEVAEELAGIVTTEFGGSREDFESFLEQRRITRADARETLLTSLQQQRLYDHATRGVRFAEGDARRFYDENPERFTSPPGRTARHILVETEEEATAIRGRVTTDNFAEVAREESTDAGSAPQGGELGTIRRGQMVPEFEEAVFALGDGEISGPVKTQFGWHLISVELVPAAATTFDEARDGIMQEQLEQRRQDVYAEWAEQTLARWEGRTVYARDELRPIDDEDDAVIEDGPPTSHLLERIGAR